MNNKHKAALALDAVIAITCWIILTAAFATLHSLDPSSGMSQGMLNLIALLIPAVGYGMDWHYRKLEQRERKAAYRKRKSQS